MAITTAICTSYKKELMTATHNHGDVATSPIGGHTFKLALFKATVSGTFGAATTNYSQMSTDEATDTASPQGYTSGGGNLTNVGATTSGTTAFCDYADLTFTAVNLSSDGCLIYNSSASNAACQVHDFGSTKTASGGDFTIQFPTADSSLAITRLA